ncbi:hypothetical protein LF41_521 [Lysobacter dokdonensis DS-58]|uniref:Uncharacterized protein n=1 Tax=Lysobacter dokdonensis DS-58 TaxID=1300345 RepID=A0A0A2WE60_9GAMM|nr:hypothetical protein LF41_521 [Lysobacter dokdonensis DS-58]
MEMVPDSAPGVNTVHRAHSCTCRRCAGGVKMFTPAYRGGRDDHRPRRE